MKKLIVIAALLVFTATIAQDSVKKKPEPRKLTKEQVEFQHGVQYILKNYPNDIKEIKNYISIVSRSTDRITGSNQKLWKTIERIDKSQKILVTRSEQLEYRALTAEAENRRMREEDRKQRELNNNIVWWCVSGGIFFFLLSILIQVYLHRKGR